MLHGSTLSLLTISLALYGCGISQHIQAEQPAKQSAVPSAQLIQQSKAAMAACDTQFPAGEPRTAVARRKCINDGIAIRMPTFGPDQDLVRAVLADSMVVAEKVQTGQMTIAEGNAAMAKKWTQAVTESQQRAHSKDSVLAQQSAAAAQQQVPRPANGATVTPVDLPGFICNQNGNAVTCN